MTEYVESEHRQPVDGTYCQGTRSDTLHKAIEESIALTKTKDAQRKVGTGRRWTKLFFLAVARLEQSTASGCAGGLGLGFNFSLPQNAGTSLACLRIKHTTTGVLSLSRPTTTTTRCVSCPFRLSAPCSATRAVRPPRPCRSLPVRALLPAPSHPRPHTIQHFADHVVYKQLR